MGYKSFTKHHGHPSMESSTESWVLYLAKKKTQNLRDVKKLIHPKVVGGFNDF